MAKHFDNKGNEIRCVYLAEFEADEHCYIGTAMTLRDGFANIFLKIAVLKSINISAIQVLSQSSLYFMIIQV